MGLEKVIVLVAVVLVLVLWECCECTVEINWMNNFVGVTESQDFQHERKEIQMYGRWWWIKVLNLNKNYLYGTYFLVLLADKA